MKEYPLVADENIALSTIKALRDSGFHVISVSEQLPAASDMAVLRCACDNNAVLLTFDRDYGELIFRRGCVSPRAIVYLRTIPESPAVLTDVLLGLLAGRTAGDITGQFVVWSRDATRKRTLP